jgi:hypothetical protein
MTSSLIINITYLKITMVTYFELILTEIVIKVTQKVIK